MQPHTHTHTQFLINGFQHATNRHAWDDLTAKTIYRCNHFSYIQTILFNWWKSMAKPYILSWSRIFCKNSCKWVNLKNCFTWFWCMFVRWTIFNFPNVYSLHFIDTPKKHLNKMCIVHTSICSVVWCSGVMRFVVPT